MFSERRGLGQESEDGMLGRVKAEGKVFRKLTKECVSF
jgi:hypothetical protein